MIKVDAAYVIPFSTTVAGEPTAADSTPTAVLWRNGSAEVTSVVIVTTANTGIYHASFTTDAGWAATDRIWLVVSATIATVSYKAVAWDSFSEPDSTFEKAFRWLGVLAGKGSDPATLAEIQATDGGATFDNATDSLEAADELSRSVGSPCTVERSLADENPITFSWVNSTDTVTGRVSIDNAAYVAVAGAIAYLRTDDGTAFYTLAFDAADRPSAEGTARYEFTSGGTVRYVTLRTAVASGGGGSAAIGDWAITRTFQISGGDKVSGVRMSLVGVAGKTDTTGTDGVATIKADDGTFTLRVVVPAGYEDVADTTVTINGADSLATVTLVATTVTPPTNPAKSALEILCLDETGEPEADVAVDIRIAVVPSGDQNIAYKGTKQTATSDANGVARLEAIKGAEYEYKRGKAEVWNRVTIGSGDTTSVSSFIGSP